MRISDWSSDVCSSDLGMAAALLTVASAAQAQQTTRPGQITQLPMGQMEQRQTDPTQEINRPGQIAESAVRQVGQRQTATAIDTGPMGRVHTRIQNRSSEEHTSELQSLMSH